MKFVRNITLNMNKFLGCLVLAMTTAVVHAQNSTASPYSQFGLGDIADQGVGFNKGMSGVGLAFRKGNEANPLNPASYSAVDSITMIFDAGLSGQITNYEENGRKLNGKSGGFDYVVGLFRLIKNVGVSFGVQPYSNIGYNYSTATQLVDRGNTVVTSYEGNGGLNKLFVGMGWRIAKPLSVGFNVAYLWGDYNKQITTSSSSTINSLSKQYVAEVNSYLLEFGLQFEQPISKLDRISIGATFSPGHKLHSDPLCQIINRNTSISKADTTTFQISNGLEVPSSIGVGVGYQRSARLRVGADLQLQKWGSVDLPAFDEAASTYRLQRGLLKDSYKMNVGAEWIPNPQSTRSLLHHVRYRIGAGYTTPYYYIGGQEGPKDFHVSLGLGIPILNGYNNRSILNISGQWQRRSADNLITENMFRLNIGLTFNERWFSKWKVE